MYRYVQQASNIPAMQCSELSQHLLKSGVRGVIRLYGHCVHLPVRALGSNPLVMPGRGAAPDRVTVAFAPRIQTICYVSSSSDKPRRSTMWVDYRMISINAAMIVDGTYRTSIP